MSGKRSSSDAPRALRDAELRAVMDAIRGGPQEDPPPRPAEDVAPPSVARNPLSSGIFRVAPAVFVDENADPVSSAPPALRPERLRGVLTKIGT